MKTHFPKQTGEKCRRTAFTLLELLVAMAVLSLLVVALLGMVDGATKLWRENESRVESYREARAALNVISGELRSFYATTNKNYFSTNFSGSPPANTFGNPLFFLATLPQGKKIEGGLKEDIRSEVAAVGYYLAFQKHTPSADQPSYNLYRYFRHGDQTFPSLLNPSAAVFSGADPGSDEIIARNITEFRVTPLYTNASGIVPTPPSANASYPDLVEVRIRAINSETANQLSSQSDWEQGTNHPAIVKNSREFVTRVRLAPPPPTP